MRHQRGEIAFVDWAPTTGGDAAIGRASGEEDVSAKEKVLWIARDHWGKCSFVLRSPFYPEILLSCGPNAFTLWREDCNEPVFRSSTSATGIASAAWSPTRPGVLLLGKIDGAIDAWDFCEQSHAPSMTFPGASCAITSMKFSSAKGGTLGVGDESGNLHILDIPRTLTRPVASERRACSNF